LAEECLPKPRAHKPKRKSGEEDETPTLSSPTCKTKVGLDLGLHYLFVAKNNINVEDKTL
jgi:hypothetical protein